MSRIIQSAVAGLALAGAASPASGTELDWSVNGGAAMSDNATRSPTDKIDDTIGYLGGGLGLTHESRRIEASVRALGNFLTYLDDTYDDDFAGSADAHFQFAFIPERFVWNFDDRFGQVTINPFQPVTPDNRENLNVFSTGPELTFRLGQALGLRLTGDYRITTYGSTDRLDYSRLAGSAALVRQSSATVLWSIVVDASSTEYDSPTNPGFDVQGAYLRLEAEGARQTLSVDAGATRLSQEDQDVSTDPLLRVTWNRRLTPSWTLDLLLGTEYRSTSDQFLFDPDVPDGGTSDVTVSGIPSRTDYLNAGLTFSRPRTSFTAGGSYSTENFFGSDLGNRDTYRIYANISRRMTTRLTASLGARLDKRDFVGTDTSDETSNVALGISWRVGRALYLTGGYLYGKRSGDVSEFEYDENVFYVGLSYRSSEDAIAPDLSLSL